LGGRTVVAHHILPILRNPRLGAGKHEPDDAPPEEGTTQESDVSLDPWSSLLLLALGGAHTYLVTLNLGAMLQVDG
jgi:hypothetical protein